MDKEQIKEYFDEHAGSWDAHMIRNEKAIEAILDAAEIHEGISVLDVACGTGVLFPDYIKRGVAFVTAVDISPQMVTIARTKYPQISIIKGDVEELDLVSKFDSIMIYNAFPHFPNPSAVIKSLAGKLKENGRLTVAHGMSRAAIDDHHKGEAAKVSLGLIHEDELAALFETAGLKVDVKISDDEKYVVSGKPAAK